MDDSIQVFFRNLTRISHHGWTLPEGRGFTGCGKTLQCCHPEPVRCHSERSEESRSAAQGKLREGSRSEYFQGNARFFVAAAPQNDSAFEFFRSLLSPAEIAAFNLNPSRMGATQKLASQVLPEMSDSALRRVTSGQRAKRVARRATP